MTHLLSCRHHPSQDVLDRLKLVRVDRLLWLRGPLPACFHDRACLSCGPVGHLLLPVHQVTVVAEPLLGVVVVELAQIQLAIKTALRGVGYYLFEDRLCDFVVRP